jgi:hypothetical protein
VADGTDRRPVRSIRAVPAPARRVSWHRRERAGRSEAAPAAAIRQASTDRRYAREGKPDAVLDLGDALVRAQSRAGGGAHMIVLKGERPQNRDHFAGLLELYKEVSLACAGLRLTPLLTGSLAVFGYTRNRAMRVNDIDLACSESAFPPLSAVLAERGMEVRVRAWRVLQVHKADLKVELDSLEYWFAGVPTDFETLVIDECVFNVVRLSSLKELYRRGLEETAQQRDAVDRAKHVAIAEKYALLCAL